MIIKRHLVLLKLIVPCLVTLLLRLLSVCDSWLSRRSQALWSAVQRRRTRIQTAGTGKREDSKRCDVIVQVSKEGSKEERREGCKKRKNERTNERTNTGENKPYKQVVRHTSLQTNKQTNKQANKQTNKQTDIQTDKQTDKQINRTNT